jgi:hypothetical protein
MADWSEADQNAMAAALRGRGEVAGTVQQAADIDSAKHAQVEAQNALAIARSDPSQPVHMEPEPDPTPVHLDPTPGKNWADIRPGRAWHEGHQRSGVAQAPVRPSSNLPPRR